MPVPVSRTVSTASVPSTRCQTVTFPSKVNFRALDIRLRTIRSHMSRSTGTGAGSGGQSTRRVSPAFSAAERNMLTRSAVTAARSTGSYDAVSRPDSRREKSSSVLTSLSRRSALRWTSSVRSRCAGGSGASVSARASSHGPSMSVSGVRNSWETLEKNVVLAASSSARASARAWAAS
jgi:hypothetical protein